ncbi:acyl-CoA synthetase (AMP-forming)/AMP-acid ligase II [Natrinema pellirubrum DSM 15624]|uniref:Acyl-CoA synthetase (AMP-forming)/AMP-acid ligase II n=1 Tax=Natrinema pellirubrum (strain DSM 15624 / CIP 106293 / JCM 10476 / NCIMB 786 / 157) TaxID=797303 RepID=L0JR76_NATP1|nr:long-chain fatty acid--CoA ligase [Natrinema pellirubrum]AGB33293.1 acyl-CoA synthetase (AMP-forming)/AMP-acid ligase II [Natrinema pellirubrum DSM 15624]
MTNLVTEVVETVDANPESPAIAYEGTELSYEAFWQRAGQFAQALENRGIGEGDRVGIYLPNLPQFVTAFYGTLRAGGIIVPMNPQYKSREISHMLGDSGAKAVVALADLVPNVLEVQDDTDVEQVVSVGADVDGATEFDDFLAEDTKAVVDRADDDVAVQPYTSGTTGTPKGVLLTHHNLAFTTRANAVIPPGGFQASDRLIGTLPLFHIYGMSVVMNGAMYSGGTYYPVPEWDATEVMNQLEDDEITIMFAVPAMFNDMINHPDAESYEFESLRFANSGGSSLPLEVLERFEDLWDVQLNEGYGLTETSPVTHANTNESRRKGSIGQPLEGVEAKIVDEDFEEVPRVAEGPIDEEEAAIHDITGELVIHGPNVMKEYYGLPEANEEAFTNEDGKRWFHTGDIGYWDEDDFFYVVDREKHMIVTGGYNVYPREVEELLFEHEDVADAAVVGVPDERRGETVKAFVVTTPDAEATPEEIKQYCLENLAEYKHPREVEFVQALPRTTTGKVQKFELRGEGENDQ